MENLMVLDGDFEAQLRRNLKCTSQTDNLDKSFALQALQNNKYAVYKTYLDYLRAGAQIIRTNTYRASINSIKKFMNLSPSENVPIFHTYVQLAKQALTKYNEETGSNSFTFKNPSRPLIAGSLGSYASSLEDETNSLKIIENISSEFLLWYHQQRISELLHAGVDLLAFESIPCMNEANAMVEVLKLYSNARAWITFLCQPSGLLYDGTSFKAAVTHCYSVLPNQIVAIGVECSLPECTLPECTLPESMKASMQKINDKRDSKIPFVRYAEKCHFSTTGTNGEYIPALQENYVKEWLDCGVRYIGGGTNTIAEDIKEIRKQVDNYRHSKGKNFTLLSPCSYRNTVNQSKL